MADALTVPSYRQQAANAQAQQAVLAGLPVPQLTPITMPSVMPSLVQPSLPMASLPVPGTVQGDTLERSRLLQTGSGISQIHNPFARTAASVGNALLHPITGLVQSVPGTNEHHQLLVAQQDQRIAQDQAQQQAAATLNNTLATTRHTDDVASEIENPKPNYTPVQTDEGLAAFDPASGTGSLVSDGKGGVLAAPSKATSPHIVTQDDGSIVSIVPDETGQLKATVVYKGDPKVETDVTKLEVNGKPHSVIVNKKTGETIKDLGETGEKPPSVSVSSGTYSLASLPDGKGGTKPVLLNNKTGEVKDAPDGLSKAPAVAAGATPPMTTADKNRASLAHIAMNNLDQVQDIVQRRPDVLGKMGLVKSTADLLGSNDPDLVALGNEVHNFAMANAGIHGSRSFQNVQAAEQELLGHFKNGAAGIQGGINANRQNLQSVINPNAPAKSGAISIKRDANGRITGVE